MKQKNAIRKLREQLILNQQEFAQVMGVDVGTVSRWERGIQRPKPEHLRKMKELQT